MGENIPHKGTQVNEIPIGLYILEQCKDTVGRGRVPTFMVASGQIKEKSLQVLSIPDIKPEPTKIVEKIV